MTETNANSMSSADNRNHHGYTQNHTDYSYNLPSASSDEISQFLRQILLRSSPSIPPESAHAGLHAHPGTVPRADLSNHGFSAADLCEQACSGPSVSGFSGKTLIHVSPSSVGPSGNETDENDFESEGVVVNDPPLKAAPPRSSSKRSRAAEVHNLSEKRRRSRINEKMKALQSLIPNSNKTDKASMLDEAIEYLKQLQLQVQMLTMRNGLSLHPLSLPAFAQERRAGFNDDNKYAAMSTASMIHSKHETSAQANLITQQNQFHSVSNMLAILNTASTIEGPFGPYHALDSSEYPAATKEHRREDVLPKMNYSDVEVGVLPPVSIPFGDAAKRRRPDDRERSEDLL